MKEKIRKIKRSRYNYLFIEFDNYFKDIETIEHNGDIYFIKNNQVILEYVKVNEVLLFSYEVMIFTLEYDIQEKLLIELFREFLIQNKNNYFTKIQNNLNIIPINMGRMMTRKQLIKIRNEHMNQHKITILEKLKKLWR